jgi:trans-aconitate methyltransferase
MTEKLFEKLALQAGLDYMPDHDLERFAQLIVQECAGACLATTEPDSSQHLVSVAYADAVKKRFGIA